MTAKGFQDEELSPTVTDPNVHFSEREGNKNENLRTNGDGRHAFCSNQDHKIDRTSKVSLHLVSCPGGGVGEFQVL
jgi:hypothetical protein